MVFAVFDVPRGKSLGQLSNPQPSPTHMQVMWIHSGEMRYTDIKLIFMCSVLSFSYASPSCSLICHFKPVTFFLTVIFRTSSVSHIFLFYILLLPTVLLPSILLAQLMLIFLPTSHMVGTDTTSVTICSYFPQPPNSPAPESGYR